MLSSRDNENTPERNPSEFGFLCAAINLFNFRRSVFSCVCREWSAKIDTTKLHYLCLLFEAFYALYARQSAFKLLSAIRFFLFFLLEMYFVCFEGGWRKSLVEKGLELLLSITSGGWVIRSKALNWGMEIKLGISSIEKRPRAQSCTQHCCARLLIRLRKLSSVNNPISIINSRWKLMEATELPRHDRYEVSCFMHHCARISFALTSIKWRKAGGIFPKINYQ